MGSIQRIAVLGSAAAAAILTFSAGAARAQGDDDTVDKLRAYSLEDLANLEVTSVSKRGEALGQAPAAIYVITHDEIVRTGATSIPEILRLAPNLRVTQTSSSRYVITARGFNGSPAAQNFANKLLVLIDGRSVYSPLFSGVYWDMQGVPLQDIDRIEVISGPGAALWGANAVNGVINITTRKASETQGGLVDAIAGDRERGVSVRYGGRIGDAITYRIYGQTFLAEHTLLADKSSAHDHWSRPQAGFRLDWTPSDTDTVTVQGDAYDGFEAQLGAPAEDISGRNLTARWTRSWAGGQRLQVQAYYDRVRRGNEVDGAGFVVSTYDLDLQHSFTAGARNEIVWGGGLRASRYDIAGAGGLAFAPPSGTLNLANLFVQDSIALGPTVKLVVGAKLEDDPYVKAQLLPTARLAWTPNGEVALWAAVSRAIRAPTPFDRDVVETLGTTKFLIGGPDFRSEKLTAYEFGARIQASQRAAFSVSTFYNVYDDLRSIEVAPGGFLPLRWGNLMRGYNYGVEAWGDYQAAPWWRLSGGASFLDGKFRFAPGSSKLVGVSQAGNDPKYQASLRSSMDLGESLMLDAALRYVSALPEPRVPAHLELNGRLGWNVTPRVQLSISGRNLLHARRQEYPEGNAIPRSAFVELQWRF